MLTQAQKIAVRRHLGVPFAGTAQAGRLFGWRFQMHVEDLEYRMNNMQPPEEVLLTGASLGSYRIDGVPSVGDRLTPTLTDSTGTNFSPIYTVQPSDISAPINGSRAFQVALGLALSFNSAAASGAPGYQAVAVQPADLFTAPASYASAMFTSYFAELLIVGPGSNAFTLASARTGTTNFVPDSQGVPSPVVATINNVTVYGYLALCDSLAMQMAGANLSLRYEVADVVTFRKDEIRARRAQYAEYCTQLSRLMGGKEYVRKFGGGGSGGATA